MKWLYRLKSPIIPLQFVIEKDWDERGENQAD